MVISINLRSEPYLKKIAPQHISTAEIGENLTALEYFDKQWSIYQYNKAEFPAGLKQIQKKRNQVRN
ncbi:MAG: hypothetical protein IPO69_15965 [Saprospiraceae bacterium]|nr:hypothetical protein [Saprospiraceae bacterium]